MKTFKNFRAELAEKKLSSKEIKRALASIKPPKKKPTLPKAPWDDKEQKEAKVDEISMGKMQAYGKAAAKDIEKHRNTVKGALDQPASPKKAQAGLDAMKKLTKRSKGSDMYVDKMTGRSKVKPTAESKVDEVLDRPGALDSYRKKADASGNKARNSATRKILTAPKDGKRPDHSDELNTMRKRNKGQDMADKVANKQFRKSIGLGYNSKKEEVEQVDEISNAKMGQYVRKATDDAARRAMDAGEKAGRGDSKGFGKQMVKSRQRVKGVQKAMDKMDKNRLYGRQ